MNSDTIFLSSGYSCGRDAPHNAYLQSISQAHNELTDQKNKSRIIAVDLETGKISWSLAEHHTGCYTQTKVTSLKDGSSMVMFPVNDGCTEPPIIVGDAVYLIKSSGGHLFFTCIVFH